MCVKKRESIVKCKDRIYDVSNTQYCSDTSGDCIVHNCSADDIVHNCSDLYKKNHILTILVEFGAHFYSTMMKSSSVITLHV